MERLRYEPFGERLAPEGDAALRRARPISVVGWHRPVLVAGCGHVIARAVFFEPGVFDEFSRVAALVKAAIFCKASLLFEHDLFGKPVPTFPDHALSHFRNALVLQIIRSNAVAAGISIRPGTFNCHSVRSICRSRSGTT